MVRALLITAVFFAPLVGLADEGDTLRICTGSRGGAYHQVGLRIAERLAGHTPVEVIPTQGSWENLEAIDATPRRCDAIIAQDDAQTLYQFENKHSKLTMDRVATLYSEYVHLLCNRSVRASNISGVYPQRVRVLVNQYGSGTYITWRLFGRLDPSYARFAAAEVSLKEGLLKVVDGVSAQCMVIVSAPGKGTAKLADTQFGQSLKLVGLTGDKLHQKLGRARRQIYQTAPLTSATYPNLIGEAIETQTVDAVFFVSAEWKAQHPKIADKLTEVLLELVPRLRTSGVPAKSPASLR